MYKYNNDHCIFSSHKGDYTFNIVDSTGQIVAVINGSATDTIESLRKQFIK